MEGLAGKITSSLHESNFACYNCINGITSTADEYNFTSYYCISNITVCGRTVAKSSAVYWFHYRSTRSVTKIRDDILSRRTVEEDYPLTFFSKTVRQQTMCVRRSSSCSVKLQNSFLRTYGLLIDLILFQLTIPYGVWCRIACRPYQTPVRDVADLRQHLIDTWNDSSHSIVDDAVDEWCKRLQACVNEKGHFEHLL